MGDRDPGDPYGGLDRFGRIQDQRWLNGRATALERVQFTYDQAGNIIHQTQVGFAAMVGASQATELHDTMVWHRASAFSPARQKYKAARVRYDSPSARFFQLVGRRQG